jgi:adenine phosphoribosyltransferase
MGPAGDIDLKRFIRDVPDFPRKGILFKDIAPLLLDAGVFAEVIRRLAAVTPRPDAVCAIESRGFLFGAPLAQAWHVPLVPVRKYGKLPGRTVRAQYSLEYGEDVLELQADALRPGMKAVVVDDLLATGGTAEATARLVEQVGGTVQAVVFVVELAGLGGREKLAGREIRALVHYELG